MVAVHQGFPNVSAEFVNDKRFIQQAWLQLLINLWTRTGAGQGNSSFSSGDVKQSAVEGDQSGWLECDGRAISRVGYNSLYDAIGTTYGIGDGSSTFNIPDYRGRFLIGTNVTYPLGTSGGATTITLGITNLPSHTHGITDPTHTHTFTGASHGHTFTGTPHTHTVTDPGHHHTALTATTLNTTGTAVGSSTAGDTGNSTTGITISSTTATGTISNTTATGTNTAAATGISTQATGSGTPISVLPPYAPVTVLIKI